MAIHSKIFNKVLASSQRGEESPNTGHSVPGYSDTAFQAEQAPRPAETAFQAEQASRPADTGFQAGQAPRPADTAFQPEHPRFTNPKFISAL